MTFIPPAKPTAVPTPSDGGSYDTLRVVVEGDRVKVIEKPRPILDDDSVSVDHRTLPLYRLHGVNHAEELAGQLKLQRSSFTQGESRFQIKNNLGEGSQGLVLRVRDRDCRRDVALKTLHHSGCDLDEISRFIHEAQVTAQLEHPAIVPVHDVGVLADGTVYYTMKRVEGTNLADHMAERAGRSEYRFDLIELFLRVCDAIAFAHSRGVIHRDIKPRNIMVGAYGEVLVLDWGLAKILGQPTASHDRIRSRNVPDSDGDIHRTMEGYAVGTPAYMSPEQARGNDALVVDQRCDVYSLGVILYELLSGVSPYQRGNVRKTLEQAARGEWTRLDRQPSGKRLPKRLVAIVHKAMVMDPERRYQSVSALEEDLRNFIAGRPVSVYHESLAEVLARQIGNHRRLVQWVAGTVLLATAVLVGWRYWLTFEEDRRVAVWRHQAQQDMESENYQEALTNLDRILGQRPFDLQASTTRDGVRQRLKNQAEQRLVEQKQKEAERLKVEARRREADGGDGELHEASEFYLKALGLTPDDRILTDSLRRVTARLAEIEETRRAGAVATATRVEQRNQAMRMVQDARAKAAANQLQDAMALLMGAITLDPTSEYQNFMKELAVSINKQQETQRQLEQRKAADQQVEVINAALQSQKPYTARDQLARLRLVCFDDSRLPELTTKVEAAVREFKERRADETLAQAKLAQEHAGVFRKDLSDIAAAARTQEILLLEHGDAVAREALHRLDQRMKVADTGFAREQAEAIRLLRQADAEAPHYSSVQKALAEYYVNLLEQAEDEGRSADAAMAVEQARLYDETGQYTRLLNGLATVTCAAESAPVLLSPIDEQTDRRVLVSGPGMTLEPGETKLVKQGRYEVSATNGSVMARYFRRGKNVEIRLRANPSLPTGIVVIPAGEIVLPDRHSKKQVEMFALARHEVTCGEWLEFLNSPENLRRFGEELLKGNLVLAPRATFNSEEPLWRQQSVPMWQKIPGSFVLETRSTTTAPSVAIRPDRPVTGISAEDIEAFLHWRSRRDGVAWRLPTPDEWILAAQGGDGRLYPWGDHPDLSLCASALAAEHWSTELSVGCVPTDRSVQGVFDLAGGVSEFTSGIGSTERLRVVMGGNYLDRQPERFQTCSRREWDVRIVYEAGGFRMAMSVPNP